MYKRVYFVGGAYMGCYYVRCFLPLQANGWSGNYMGLTNQLKNIKLQMAEMMNSDIIVFHRADTDWHHKTAIALKAMGKKIVFDNDDSFKLDATHAFYKLDDAGFKTNVERKNNVINNFILNCDLVTASTEHLAKEYRKINPNVVVLPNCVNPDDWDTPLRNEGKKVRIGIVGSTAYYHDFDIIKDEIKKLSEDPRVQLVMFGLHNKALRKSNPLTNKTHKREYAFWDTIKNLEHVPWCQMTDYFRTLNELRLDMMIIPRRESEFNKAKSNVKFLEAAMCEIPVIASSFEDAPYEKDIDGTNGILVKEGESWLEAIEKLMDKDTRRKMGKEAHKYVLKNYQIKKHANKWVKAYNKL